MAKDWEYGEDLTVVEEKKAKEAAVPEADDETVAFTKKSSLFSKKHRRRASEEESQEVSKISPFDSGRFPLHAALPRDRFAAFFVDTLILIYILSGLQSFLTQQLFNQALFVNLSQRWPFIPSLSMWIVGFIVVIFYYVAFEAIGGATPGKYLCRLRVVDLDGSTPTLANVFLRNLCRLFDYPLFFGVAVLSMESSRFYQRLGDRAARTVVIKKTSKKMEAVDLRSIILSSTFVRAFGFFLDLIFFGTFVWFYLAALNPNKLACFQFFMVLFPLLLIGYFIIFEMFTSSTPGKILLKRQSILANGEPLDATAAILRNLLRPLDVILGYPFLILSRQKQRLGDYVAETLVIKKEPQRHSAIALGVLFALLLGLIFVSSRNAERKWFYKQVPDLSNILNLNTNNSNQKTNVQNNVNVSPEIKNIPVVTRPRNGAKPQSTSSTLKVTEFYLSAGPDPTQIRSDAVFHPGDLIFAFFKLAGFQKESSGKAELIEDVQMEAPNGELLLDKTDVIKFSQSLADKVQHVLFANQILLPQNPQTGSYKILFILHDQNTNTQLVYEKSFVLQ